ncbi:uncharacterized protein LOC128200353 [Galleria mellonella]|uniref:Uncharacterized protein LOC128200353 n=1 Tax=Galleria mellonella TaxID=7137 RepID=A0ABM3MDL4_GALME|nr:uncharacterized protein LOC128200353 [Galleria mellonella]
MWWRILTFCVLVTFVLFVVLSCIHGRPVVQLFFHRCCEDNIENDQLIYENLGNNFLKERLVAVDDVVDNSSLASKEDVDELIVMLREKMNVHNPVDRTKLKHEDASRLALGDVKETNMPMENDTNFDDYTTDNAIIAIDKDIEGNTTFNKEVTEKIASKERIDVLG